jgi:hypothetical protein
MTYPDYDLALAKEEVKAFTPLSYAGYLGEISRIKNARRHY